MDGKIDLVMLLNMFTVRVIENVESFNVRQLPQSDPAMLISFSSSVLLSLSCLGGLLSFIHDFVDDSTSSDSNNAEIFEGIKEGLSSKPHTATLHSFLRTNSSYMALFHVWHPVHRCLAWKSFNINIALLLGYVTLTGYSSDTAMLFFFFNHLFLAFWCVHGETSYSTKKKCNGKKERNDASYCNLLPSLPEGDTDDYICRTKPQTVGKTNHHDITHRCWTNVMKPQV